MAEYKNVLFKDSFVGTAGYPPDRGKWFAFLTRENSSVEFTDGMIEPTVNGCRFGAAVDSNGWGGLNLMSRAEFKVPFKIRVAIKPTDFGFYFYLLSPDVRDGHFLGTEVYGMWVATIYGTTADNKFKFVLSQNYTPKTNTSTASWSLNTEYIIEMEATPYANNTSTLLVALSVKLASNGSTVWETSDWCDQSLSETLRCAFSARAEASDSIEFYAKSLIVFGNQTRKAKAIVSAVTGTDKRVITDDVIDFQVSLRDGSHPQASLTVKNEGLKTKEIAVETYDCLLKSQGLTWSKPQYKSVRKLPFILTEDEINNLIAGCNKKTSAFLQLLKETGMRCGEGFMLKWTDFDFENKTVNITPEKGSEPRQLKISPQLISMLNSLPKKKEEPFACSSRHFTRYFRSQRANVANKLKNDRIRKITFHTLRHWKATMEYHKTRDILHVMKMLGHRNIQNTLLYTQLISFENDDYHSATAQTVEDAQKLIEAGFEYVCEFSDVKIFRRRK